MGELADLNASFGDPILRVQFSAEREDDTHYTHVLRITLEEFDAIRAILGGKLDHGTH
jgi:hypothetical protein